jgi:hypothetical protein
MKVIQKFMSRTYARWYDNSIFLIEAVGGDKVFILSPLFVCLFVFVVVGLFGTAALKAYCTLTP